MTRDEILNMPAGREMDILIGKMVFGMGVANYLGHAWGNVVSDGAAGFHEACAKPYSTDIAAAWEVVEYLRASGGYWIDLESSGRGGKLCEAHLYSRGGDGVDTVYAHGPTAPLAICRAALLVMEAE